MLVSGGNHNVCLAGDLVVEEIPLVKKIGHPRSRGAFAMSTSCS